MNASPEARARRVFGMLLVVLGLLLARTGYIQIVEGADYTKQARRMHFARLAIPAPRGRILDRFGRPLVASYHAVSVAVDPQLVDGIATYATRLAFLLREPNAAGEFARRITAYKSAGKRFVYLRRRIDRDAAASLRGVGLTGLDLREEPRRDYPHGAAAAALFGVVGADKDGRITGLTGLEYRFDRSLTGSDGSDDVFKSGRRESLYLFPEQGIEPRPGNDLATTLDIRIQQIAESALDVMQEKHRPTASCAIVVDPKTGAILALAGRPSLDPRKAATLKIPAIHRVYELGSVVKPLVMAGAMTERAVQPGQMFDCGPGYKFFGGRRLRDVKPNHRIDLETILVKSSNIGMAQVGQALGIDSMRAYLGSLGFGARTGVELPGEEAVPLKPRSEWTENYTLVSVSMGRELQITPMQLVRAYAALFNGGRLNRLSLLRGSRRPAPSRVHFSRDATEFVVAAMEKVVAVGTGRRARIKGLRVGGKTGSSEMYPNGSGRYVSSFIGFAPVDDPRLLVLVVAEDPKQHKKYVKPYGGVVAAPVVGEILRRSLPLYDRTPVESGIRYSKNELQSERKVRVAAVHRSSVLAGEGVSPANGRNPDSSGVHCRRGKR